MIREAYDQAGYRIVSTWPEVAHGYVVLEDADGTRELWHRTRAATAVLTIGDGAYEFVRTVHRVEACPHKEYYTINAAQGQHRCFGCGYQFHRD